MQATQAQIRTRSSSLAIWSILALYGCARILEVAPFHPSQNTVVALDVLSALAFAVFHGRRQYGWRGVLAFTAICLLVGNIVENIGVATGFPFGRYYFTGLMGPKLFHVPVLLGLAYIGMAYVSWTLARLIVGHAEMRPTGARIVLLPLVASVLMVSWDVAQDPIWATVLKGWIWLDGGLWFGVPISNYAGWFCNVFLMYLLFALYLRRRPAPLAAVSRANWPAAVLFYAICAAGNVLQRIPPPNPALVQDPTGKVWRVTDITAASALVSILAMGAFAAIAWIRLGETKNSAID